jgi:uncharacterized protein (UPF0210 family)
MINKNEVLQTIEMLDQQHLNIRTITMGISLLDCADVDMSRCAEKIYDKISRRAAGLVRTGEDIEKEYGIPIVNKRIAVSPMSILAGGCPAEDCLPLALAMDRAPARRVNFIGGYSALVTRA